EVPLTAQPRNRERRQHRHRDQPAIEAERHGWENLVDAAPDHPIARPEQAGENQQAKSVYLATPAGHAGGDTGTGGQDAPPWRRGASRSRYRSGKWRGG